jgi:riboflavin synthase
VAVDGACLTVAQVTAEGFAASASAETLSRSTLGQARPGQGVHLERALRLGDRLGGHLVTGHVDAVGRVAEHQPRGGALRVAVDLPADLEPFVAEKGSVAVDGVSLTVNGVAPGRFWVMLVPFTRAATHLDRKRPGEAVNLETDVLAKYVGRLLGVGRGDGERAEGRGLTMDLLIRQGFVR